jgi:hypothetical protein
MVFKLLEGAQKSWRRLDGHNQLPKLVLGVTFNDGIEVIAKPTDPPDRPGHHQKLAIAHSAATLTDDAAGTTSNSITLTHLTGTANTLAIMLWVDSGKGSSKNNSPS